MPSCLALEPAALAMHEAAVVECERLLASALPAERSNAAPEKIKLFQTMPPQVRESVAAFGDDRFH